MLSLTLFTSLHVGAPPSQWGSGQDQMRVVKQRLLEMVPNFNVFLECAFCLSLEKRHPASQCHTE